MKVIVAGTRPPVSYKHVKDAIANCGFEIDEIVSGNAWGVDRLGELYAQQNHIDLVIFPANWEKYGKSAGLRRNEKMANYADALVAVWDGQSKGTKHMIETATKKGLKVFVWKIPQNTTTTN